MVNDLRTALYAHLQKLSLKFHHQQQTGDLLYRVMSDTFSAQGMVMNGFLPLASATFMLVGDVHRDGALRLRAVARRTHRLPSPLCRHPPDHRANPPPGHRPTRGRERSVLPCRDDHRCRQARARPTDERRRPSPISARGARRASLWRSVSTAPRPRSASSWTRSSRWARPPSSASARSTSSMAIYPSASSPSSCPTAVISTPPFRASHPTSPRSPRRALESSASSPSSTSSPTSRMPRGLPHARRRGAIRFENVTLRVRGGSSRPPRRGPRHPRGEKVALVGGPGAGKSTLASLVLRFFDPPEGSRHRGRTRHP